MTTSAFILCFLPNSSLHYFFSISMYVHRHTAYFPWPLIKKSSALCGKILSYQEVFIYLNCAVSIPSISTVNKMAVILKRLIVTPQEAAGYQTLSHE